jgi:hypothetical protein
MDAGHREAEGVPLDVMAREWYAKHLKAAGEVGLAPTRTPSRGIYRVTYLPTFGKPIVVRLDRANDSFLLEAKRLSGQGGYDPGVVEVEHSAALSPAQWSTFKEIFDRIDFWTLPSYDELVTQRISRCKQGSSDDCWAEADGEMWILEAAEEDRYHAADRWSDVNGPFRDACVFLIAASEIVSDEQIAGMRQEFRHPEPTRDTK